QTSPVPQDEDKRKPMFIQAHDPDYVPEPIYPEYIPLEDEHMLLAKEQPLPPADSQTAESPGYVTESDPEKDPEEYKDDDTKMMVRDDADDEDEEEDEEDEEEHLALADSAVVVPTDEPISPPEGIERSLLYHHPPLTLLLRLGFPSSLRLPYPFHQRQRSRDFWP
ncbi:hypothetical protein Tco_0245247, partial [Tanacetum coccineum]